MRGMGLQQRGSLVGAGVLPACRLLQQPSGKVGYMFDKFRSRFRNERVIPIIDLGQEPEQGPSPHMKDVPLPLQRAVPKGGHVRWSERRGCWDVVDVRGNVYTKVTHL